MEKINCLLVLSMVLILIAACDNPEQNSVTEDGQTEDSQLETEDQENPEEVSAIENNNPTQERIDFLLEQAMYYYWHGSDLEEDEKEFFQGLTLKGDQDVIESIFEQVIELDPINIDYQQALASTMVINNKLDQAVEVLENVINTEPNKYDALVQYYVYSGLQEGSFENEILEKLKEINPEKTDTFIKDFERLEEIRSEPVPVDVKEYEDDHLFVLLGYALDEEGNIQEALEYRLELALKLLKQNPTSKIIVTGGVPKNGINEAQAMHEWLVDQGIDEDRIIQESLATDTVENALFSMKKATEIESSNNLTVISSAVHIRRSISLFEVANRIVNDSLIGTEKIDYEIDAIGEPTGNEELVEESDETERLVMYRDLLRLEGIWQFPNLQR